MSWQACGHLCVCLLLMSSQAMPKLAAERRLQLLAKACNTSTPAIQQASMCSKSCLCRPEARPDKLSTGQQAQGANKSDISRAEASQQHLHQIQHQVHHHQPQTPLSQTQSGTAKTVKAVKVVQAVKTAYTQLISQMKANCQKWMTRLLLLRQHQQRGRNPMQLSRFCTMDPALTSWQLLQQLPWHLLDQDRCWGMFCQRPYMLRMSNGQRALQACLMSL